MDPSHLEFLLFEEREKGLQAKLNEALAKRLSEDQKKHVKKAQRAANKSAQGLQAVQKKLVAISLEGSVG